jgi:hypothetical protein
MLIERRARVYQSWWEFGADVNARGMEQTKE